jgi:ABC-type branched-subunit amino acid transport system ATPase component
MGGHLELSGVTAGYGGSDVLQGVDITVPPGSVTCVIGPNGAGKSTVLRTVNGLLRPRLGSVTLDGQEIGGLDPAAVLSRGVVQVPQQGGMFAGLTVRENVLMGGYVLRKDRDLVKRRYAQVTETLPVLKEWERRRAGNLSGGQRRLVEFARSLMLEPSVVLLDEPSMGLDPQALRRVYDLVRLFAERDVTVLLVEQNVRIGLSVATDVVVMESGRVRLRGQPKTILDSPEIASLYLGGGVETPGAATSAVTTRPAES